MKRLEVGARFGKLVVTELLPERKALCVCDCGNTTIAYRFNLPRGNTSSCGCIRRAMYNNNHPRLKHGHSKGGKSRTYSIWINMNARCHTPSSSSFDYYGAQGVSVCERWRNSFDAFLEDMGSAPAGMSIDRVNGSMVYSKETCRWATAKEQANNRRPRGTALSAPSYRQRRWPKQSKAAQLLMASSPTPDQTDQSATE